MIWDISSILKVNCHVSGFLEIHLTFLYDFLQLKCHANLPVAPGVKASDAARMLRVPLDGWVLNLILGLHSS